jgi:tripartite ATP-independent transporter DctM subunit
MSIEVITIIMFSLLFVLLTSGAPISFVLGGISVVFLTFLWGPNALQLMAMTVFQVISWILLVAIPLFIFMGLMLEKSGIVDDLFDAMNMWIGGIRGGMCIGTVGICVIIAAMVGLTGPAMVTMGLIALPAMLKRGYDKRMVTGAIMSAASLGFLIPPSVIAIFYALIARVSVGKMFVGGILPGLLLASLYSAYIFIRSSLQPHMAPKSDEHFSLREKLKSLVGLILPAAVVFSVLGSIILGVATPTEAAAIGAIAAVGCVLVKKRFAWSMLFDVLRQVFIITSLLMWIICAAALYGKTYDALGASEMVQRFFEALNLGPWGILICMQLSMFVLGMFLDDTAIFFVVVPLYLQIIDTLGFSRLWFGVLFLINMQMAFVSPPFGYNIFYMKSVAPPEVKIEDIYMSVWPFMILMGIALALCMIFPQIILYLPEKLFAQ